MHDPLCPKAKQVTYVGARCMCHTIRIVRKDEDEKVAQALEAVDPVEWALAGQHAGRDAAQIARLGIARDGG